MTDVSPRPLLLDLPSPPPGLRAVIAVPARDEAEALPALVAALAAQHDGAGGTLLGVEALVVVNNSRDGSADVARAAAHAAGGTVRVHVAEVALAPHEAHAGRARQVAMDAAAARVGARGAVLTTDADTRPASDWVAATLAELAAGADAVGGRILLCPDGRAAMPAALRRLVLLDAGYRRALEAVRHLVAPDAHDPYPRHHQHFGGSLAVTAAAYARAGGVPAVPALEDVALVRALQASGARVRHSDRVRVWTSARRVGRASDGLACEMARWERLAELGRPLLVESADAAVARLVRLGRWRRDHASAPPPLALTDAPHPLVHAEPVERALAGLRAHAARLAARPFPDRLAEPVAPRSVRLAA